MRHLVILLSLLSSISLSSQNWSLENINEISLTTDRFIAVDKFNALYHTIDNVIYKTDIKESYQFSALQLGTLTSVDIVNPLKITLFYESSNTALILDNTLNEISRTNFSTIENFRNVSHVTTAGDRRLWIFNTDLQQLEIFDYNTEKINTQFPPMEDNATALASNFNFAWITNRNGLFYYNNYGSFLGKITIPEAQIIVQDKGAVIAYSGTTLYYKPKNTTEFFEIKIPDLTIKQLSLKDEILYLYDGQKLATFRLQLAKQP